jgi:hypothetical protein
MAGLKSEDLPKHDGVRSDTRRALPERSAADPGASSRKECLMRTMRSLLSVFPSSRAPTAPAIERPDARWVLACSCAVALAVPARADFPFASEVVAYTAGSGAVAGFNNPLVALGPPERFTGEGLIPGAVTPFQPAFRPNEVVSLGVGGELVLAFDRQIVDDPRNPFGVDILVFGNAFFTDGAFGLGIVAGLAAEGGTIAVSADGVDWRMVAGLHADGLFPTLGYLDVGPFSPVAGTVESDFTRPVDPGITLHSLIGLSHEEVVERYAGSGGGAGIDIGALGLASARFVRITGPSAAGMSPEIDAIAAVAPAGSPADLDGDGMVGASDLSMLLSAWGIAGGGVAGGKVPSADLDGDGVVAASDLAILLAAWGATR